MAINLRDRYARVHGYLVTFFFPLDAYWIRLLYCTTIFVCALIGLFFVYTAPTLYRCARHRLLEPPATVGHDGITSSRVVGPGPSTRSVVRRVPILSPRF